MSGTLYSGAMLNHSTSEFPEVQQSTVRNARDLALAVLQDGGTPWRLASYYDPERDYVGRSFVGLEPNDPKRITATDLMATSMLSIKFPASAVRRLLYNDTNQQEITARLDALPNKALEDTTPDDFQTMAAFYRTVRPLLSNASSKTSKRWVAASKLVARKRPNLFPVRDSVVCGYLDILSLKDHHKDWFVFREIMRDEAIKDRLAELPAAVAEEAEGSRAVLDVEPLRLLDAALWMYAR